MDVISNFIDEFCLYQTVKTMAVIYNIVYQCLTLNTQNSRCHFLLYWLNWFILFSQDSGWACQESTQWPQREVLATGGGEGGGRWTGNAVQSPQLGLCQKSTKKVVIWRDVENFMIQ